MCIRDRSQFIKLYNAKEIQITDYSKGDDLSALGNTSDNQAVAGNTEGVTAANVIATDLQITLTADTTYTDVEAALVRTVSKVALSGDGTDLTIEADAFDLASNEWSALTTVQGTTSSDTNKLIIADDSDNSGGNIDLYQISDLTDIDAVTIAGDSGANIIALSDALTSGKTTVDLGSGDSAKDRIYFAADDSSFISSGSMEYVTVNNFNVNHDLIGLYYYNMSNDGGSGNGVSAVGPESLRSSDFSGTVSLTKDRSFIEEDARIGFSDMTAYDTTAEIKEVVANAVGSLSDTSSLNFPPARAAAIGPARAAAF